MHRPGEAADDVGSDQSVIGKETWSQFASKVRTGRRRVRVVDVAAKMSYEYQMLKKMCRKRPNMRQWAIRDDFCDMSPGVVVMSPSMQAAFMKIFRLKDKGSIRRCLRDIIPIIEYRNREERQASRDPDDLIPKDQPDTLNQKKRELFERRVTGDNHSPLFLHDNASQAKLRRKIRQRLIKFQRQLAVSNAIASRTVLYSEDDAIGYFLFRGPAMYAGVHRVLFEVSKLLPHFVPKTMLDFGAGTGTAILVAKEVYDPGSLAYPLYRSMRQTMTGNKSSQGAQLEELRYDLKRLERNNVEKKKARFLAVAALIDNGEVALESIPEDLRSEIVETARKAAEASSFRKQKERLGRHRAVVSGAEWTDSDPLGEQSANTEDTEDILPGEEPTSEADGKQSSSWWERFVDAEAKTTDERVSKRLRPLQEIVAVEPSPGMMEVGVMVVHEDVPNVSWKRYLLPEDETIQHDLVISAYTLSEIADEEQRMRMVKQLWRMTSGVLVLVEFASLTNFDMMMKMRDAILEEKNVGMWDWQPTIVAPCPHEQRCPLRHAKYGVKRKRARVCHSNVHYRSTFVEVWARHLPLKVGIEPITYMVFARNEMVPQRADERKRKIAEAEKRAVMEREWKQRELYEASLSVKDVVFERLSDEALHDPQTGVPPPLPRLHADRADGISASANTSDAVKGGTNDVANFSDGQTQPQTVKTSNRTSNLIRFPENQPAPNHKFNRGFVDAGFQRTRAISPQEMLTVRGELGDTRQRFWNRFPSYYRIISDPLCQGKVTADFCCPNGELMRGRVYRRFHGDQNTTAGHQSMRWQHIGGWRLLRRVRKGSLFPSDVPLYTVSKFPQVDFPNTLLDKKLSTLEKTAMALNDPMDILSTSDSELSVDDLKAKRVLQRDLAQQKNADAELESIFGAKLNNSEANRGVDGRQEIATSDWHEAVRKAKQRVVRHSQKAVPNAAKIRSATHRLRQQSIIQMKRNRQRN